MLEHPNDTSFGIFSVEIYEGLTRDEARSVANQHNARCETLKVTFQDKVRQARQLKEEGEEHLSTKVAAMLSDMLLKDVCRSSCTTLVSVARYTRENYAVVEEIFESYELAYGAGKSVPEKMFRILQSPVFTDEDIKGHLIRAKDFGLGSAAKQAEKSKKMKTVKNTFKESVAAATWEEAKECYPAHTEDAILEQFTSYPANQTVVSRKLAAHINSALQDQSPPHEHEKAKVEIIIKKSGVVLTEEQMKKIRKEIDSIKEKVLKVEVTQGEE